MAKFTEDPEFARLMQSVVRPQLRVWWVSNGRPERYPVASAADGARIIAILAERDLDDPECDWNTFGLETLEDLGDGRGEQYGEWYDEDGNDIDGWIEEHHVSVLHGARASCCFCPDEAPAR